MILGNTASPISMGLTYITGSVNGGIFKDKYARFKKSFYKQEHGFKAVCREGEDPLETKNIPLRKREQQGGSHIGKKKTIVPVPVLPQNCNEIIKDDTFMVNSTEKIAGEIPISETYVHLLKCGHVNVIDERMTSFLIPEIDQVTCLIREDSILIVTRQAKSFSDEVKWVYSCSCDPERQKLLESLSDRIVTDFEVFSSTFHQCLHCQAVSIILEEVDGFYDICPEIQKDHDYTNKKSTTFEIKDIIPVNKDTVCISCSIGPGIVKVTNTFIQCLTCKSSSCSHVTPIANLLRDENEDLPEELLDWKKLHTSTEKKDNSFIYRCFSTKKIPFDFSHEISDILQTPLDVRFEHWIIHVTQPKRCTVCSKSDFQSLTKSVDVITQNLTHPLQVNMWKCKDCKSEVTFDGEEYGVINMGLYCVAYEVLRRFLFYFLQGKSTMFTEYVVLRQMYLDHGEIQIEKHFSYQKLQMAWYSFIDLLDINYEQGFVCSQCGPQPTTVVMDATTLSFRKRMLSSRDVFGYVDRHIQKC